MEFTLLNVLMVEMKIKCGPDKFYGRSKFGQYDEVKNRDPLLMYVWPDSEQTLVYHREFNTNVTFMSEINPQKIVSWPVWADTSEFDQEVGVCLMTTHNYYRLK